MSLDGLARQALRFGGVGLLATLVHVSVAWLASQTVLADPFQANVAGFLAAFAVSYSGHFYFTFARQSGHRQALLRFLLLSLAGLALSNAVVWLVVIRLGLPFAVAMAAVGVAVPAASFLAARNWAFNRSAAIDLAPVLLILAAGAAAFTFYGAQHLNHDSSWYLVATRKWLAGATLYRDVMEINPPLAFFLTAPGLWLADALAIGDTAGFQLYVMGLGVGALLVLFAMLQRTPALSPLSRHATLAATALACFVLPMADFGQREHLMVMLVLPYMALFAMAPAGLRVGLLASLAIGMMAALGLALKPHFLAAPLLLAGMAAWQERSLRPFFHPANLVLGGFCIAYLLVIWLAFPLYLSDMLPLGTLVYWAFGTGTAGIFLQPLLLLTPLAILAALHGAGQGTRRAVTLRWLAAATGFAIAYLVQGKGWSYQLLPVSAMLLPALACSVMPDGTARQRLALPAAICAVLLLGLPVAIGPYRSSHVEAFGPVLAEAPANPALLMLSARLSAGFPLATESNARWVSRYPTQWVVPGAVRLLADPACATPGACRPARDALDRARTETVADMLANPPDVIIADMQADKTYFGGVAFDYVDWLRQDPVFATLLTGYRLDGTVSGHAIWRRVH